MELPVFVVDAFTGVPLSGNPAAVCLLGQDLAEEMHQKIAAEMNLSETAFVRTLSPMDDFSSATRFGLRWFTPSREVALCGHATLATAAILHSLGNTNARLAFHTLSGELAACHEGDHIALDLPLNPTEPLQDKDEFKTLIQVAVGEMSVQDVRYSPGTCKLLIRLSDVYTRQDLERMPIDPGSLLRVERASGSPDVMGVIVTLRGCGGDRIDFYSRYFAPWVGINEDPVTGSAHTVLASYWSKELGKQELTARQCSPRGGELQLSLQQQHGRVSVSGQSRIVLRGSLHL
ncbi:phenazine biosynthesis-like domain-containing protein [Lampetra fluviatilis]